MSRHQVSYPRAAKKSITEESGRPGTCRSKVGCEAMDEPCTNRIRPAGPAGSPACLFHMKSFAPSSLCAQCSVPLMRNGLFICCPSLALDSVCRDDLCPFLDLRADMSAECIWAQGHRVGTLLPPGGLRLGPRGDGVDLAFQALDDRLRRSRRRHEADPHARLIAVHAGLRK